MLFLHTPGSSYPPEQSGKLASTLWHNSFGSCVLGLSIFGLVSNYMRKNCRENMATALYYFGFMKGKIREDKSVCSLQSKN